MHRPPLLSVLILTLAGAAHGQIVDPPADSGAPVSAPTDPANRVAASAEAAGFAARAIARIAAADLKLQSNSEKGEYPDERDFRIAAELLEVAYQIDPQDEDILRLLIEAWNSAGDADRVDALNRELLRIDPRDTVTQLAVVSSNINRLQNADDRLAAYAKFLGPEGEALDASIRSRLAMDAALLKRERGDDKGFAETLALACRLDSTNKDAATLALTYFVDRVPDAAGRFELLANVLKADPFDPEIHAALAQELSAAGAFKGADRFYSTLMQLRGSRGEKLTPQESAEVLVSGWNVRGPEEIVRRLTDDIEARRADLRSRREQAAAAGALLEQIPDPAGVRLGVPAERTRVIASAAIGDAEMIGYALLEAEETIQRALDSVTNLDTRPESMTEEEAASAIQSLKAERVWLRVWAGRTTEEAVAEIEELRADPTMDSATLKRMDACLKMRRGLLEEAQRELSDLAREDVLAAVGLAILFETKGEKDKAVELHTELARRLSGSLAGSYCRTRVIKLTGRPPAATDLARKLQTLSESIPASIEAMISEPRRFMDLHVELLEPETQMFDKVEMRFTLENTSRFPMAMGPDKPINSRFLLSPMVDLGVQRMSVPGLQEVVWINRRLRLMPGEKLVATIWADNGILGGLLQRLPGTSARIRWRVVQGFRLNQEGIYETGPQCLMTETETLSRPVLMRSVSDIPSLIGWIEKGTTREMAESIFAFIERLSVRSDTAPTQADVDAFANAAVARYKGAERYERVFLLISCPPPRQLPPMSALDLAAGADADDGMTKLILALRVPTADAPQLADGAWSSRPSVQAFADLLRTRLAEGATTVATLGGPREDPAEASATEGAGSVPPSQGR